VPDMPHRVWTLVKGDRYLHRDRMAWPHGLEQRLDVDGEKQTTRLCRAQDERLKLHVEWKDGAWVANCIRSRRNSPLVGHRPPLKQSLQSGAGLDMSAGDSSGGEAGVEGARSLERCAPHRRSIPRVAGPRDPHRREPRILVGQDAVASAGVPGSPATTSRAMCIAHRAYGTPRRPEAPVSGSARG
jgi:hypothetical protein